jgi:hypothetical protein
MRGRKPLDLTAEMYGRLLLLKSVGKSKSGKTLWLCLCSCGTKIVAPVDRLRSGKTRSCGCLRKETSSTTGKITGPMNVAAATRAASKANTTHGHTTRGKTSEYGCWVNMRQRCLNPAGPRFKDWGGRGISVCKRWDRYENFLADMGARPPGLTLERIDNEGNYEPSNCCWATYSEQHENKRPYKHKAGLKRRSRQFK